MAVAYAALAAFQLAGNYFAAENIKETAALNQEIAEMNAEFAEIDAYEAEIAGYSEAARYQGVIDATLGRQTVLLASQDVDVNYGTAAAIREESKFIGEINKMEIINQAEAQALGFTREARNYRLGGFLDYAGAKARAQAVLTRGIAQAGSTGLAGYSRSYTPSRGAGSSSSQSATTYSYNYRVNNEASRTV